VYQQRANRRNPPFILRNKKKTKNQKCLCGNTLSGTDEDKCGLIDSVAGDVKIPESKFL